jgi:nicotinate-nucleotide adenylyltransferase
VTERARPVVAGSLGVLGGTFDPIHIGHLAVAEEAREVLGLERVMFVPAGIPPHKMDRPISPAAHRLAMVELAVADNPAFSVGRLEIERAGPSYTVDTLDALAQEARADGREPDLTLIVSVEGLRELRTWRDPLRILDLARLAVVPRDGYPDAGPAVVAEQFPGLEDRVVFLSGPRLRISASELRDRVAHGRSVRYLVPEAVAAYIGDHDLYADPIWRTDRT